MAEWDDFIAFTKRHNGMFLYGAGKNQIFMNSGLKKIGLKTKGLIVSDDHYMVMDGVFRLSEKAGEIIKSNLGVLIGTDLKYLNEILANLIDTGINISDVYILTNYEKDILIKKGVAISGKKYKDIKPIDGYATYLNYIKDKAVLGRYNLLCHLHLGDTIALLGLNEAFKAKYGQNIRYLITENQSILPLLYGIDDYETVEPLRLSGSALSDLTYDQIEMCRQQLYENMFTGIPQTEAPFLASPCEYIKFQGGWKDFVNGWSKMLGLDVNRIETPELPVSLTDSMYEKLGRNVDVERICLFAPELKSFRGPSKEYWEALAIKKKKEGYTVITNTIHEESKINNSMNIDMTLKELLSLAGVCGEIYSARSGFCDCVVARGSKLHVFYPPEMNLKYFSLNKNFYVNSKVDEKYIVQE